MTATLQLEPAVAVQLSDPTRPGIEAGLITTDPVPFDDEGSETMSCPAESTRTVAAAARHAESQIPEVGVSPSQVHIPRDADHEPTPEEHSMPQFAAAQRPLACLT